MIRFRNLQTLRTLYGLLCCAVFAGSCQENAPLNLVAGEGAPQTGVAILGAESLPGDAESAGGLTEPCAAPANAEELLRQVLVGVNIERAVRGIRPVTVDPTLTDISEFYACRLVDGGFFDHQDPYDGSTVATRAADFGYSFAKVGENLAAGQTSADQAVADWMKSPPHRALILDSDYTQVGIAVREGGPLGLCWVLEFGRPATAEEYGLVREVKSQK